MKRVIFAAAILLILEGLIITLMLILPFAIPMNVRVLDIVVLSVCLWTMGFDLFRPIVSLAVKNPPEPGSLGVRWTGQILYTVLAVAFLVCGLVFFISFLYQLLGQIFLFVVLLLTFFASSHASQKVTEVAKHENLILNNMQQMRMAFKILQDKASVTDNLPEYFLKEVNNITERLRFIAPSDNPKAVDYERQFADITEQLLSEMSDFSMNEPNIRQNLRRLEIILENRKNTYN